MSVKQLFASEEVEYLLPAAAGASVGESITLAAPGELAFGTGAAPATTITVNYTLVIAGGPPISSIPMTFVNSSGVTSVFCAADALAIATAGNVDPGLATFSLGVPMTPQLANMLPASGVVARTSSAFICNLSGGTWLGDVSIDDTGLISFDCEHGVTFVNGDMYQLGVTPPLGSTSYCLGSWVSAV